MAVLVKVESAAGALLFETDSTEADVIEIGLRDRAKDIVRDAKTTYESVAATIRQCTQELLSMLDELLDENRHGGSLSTAVLELGVKITGEGNVIVAKGTAEANLKVTLSWGFG